ncbi:MAG: DUF2079 domain-containing protein [Isosphaeraceae bacterium]|nr:DUF2079 domain-containing protein [Isosphaeraceae bacterium]
MSSSRRDMAAWLVVVALAGGLAAYSAGDAFQRYDELRSGWSWDLAYYNQWFWALTRGEGVITVRPLASYAEEGPSIWKMNYLAPIRFAIAPIYALAPGPKTLLAVQNVLFWLGLPAAYGLALAESGSRRAAMAATTLVPLTPLLWPLVANDFRELQLAFPFVLWGVQGVRGRAVRWAALGIAGMLAARQEFGLVVASLCLLPPREPEDIGRSYIWARTLWLVGLGWVIAFFAYLKWVVGPRAPELYLEQFLGPKASPGQTLATALDFLAVGLGSWAALACLAPRALLLALPWVWSLSSGRWALRFLGTEQWHHVRYTAPMVFLVLAAGLIGLARLFSGLLRRTGGPWLALAVWFVLAAGLVLAGRELQARFDRIPRPISKPEAEEVWRWIREVRPDEGVLAVYDVAAPLSSRAQLYSYILEPNRPRGFPKLAPDIRWVFLRRGDFPPQVFTDQGFVPVHEGPYLLILRRPPGSTSRAAWCGHPPTPG